MNILRQLAKDTVVYGIGAVVIKSISFFTLPIYTRLFSPEEYGVIEMLITLSGIFAIFMTMGLDSAHSYFFMEAKNKKNGNMKVISTSIFQMRIIIGLIVIIVSSILSSFITSVFFEQPISNSLLWMVLASTFFGSIISQSLEIFRLIYKPWQYIGLSFFQTIVGIAFILLFSYVLNKGVHGYFLGLVTGSVLTLILSWLVTRKYRVWAKIDSKLWKEFLKFGLPLVPSRLMMWIMQASDRWFIMKMLGTYDVGLYAISAKFALLFTLAIAILSRAANPVFMELIHKENGHKMISRLALIYSIIGAIGVIFLTLISKDLVKLIAGDAYIESWVSVGYLAFSSYMYGFTYFTWLGTFKAKKTYLNNIALFVSAVSNIIFNILLIPKFGITGAAIGSCIALLLSNILMIFISNRYFYVEWQYFRMLIIISLSSIIIYKLTF